MSYITSHIFTFLQQLRRKNKVRDVGFTNDISLSTIIPNSPKSLSISIQKDTNILDTYYDQIHQTYINKNSTPTPSFDITNKTDVKILNLLNELDLPLPYMDTTQNNNECLNSTPTKISNNLEQKKYNNTNVLDELIYQTNIDKFKFENIQKFIISYECVDEIDNFS